MRLGFKFVLVFLQDLRSSQTHKADLQASADELRQKLAKEAGLCRDLTSDLNRTQAELGQLTTFLQNKERELTHTTDKLLQVSTVESGCSSS